VEWIDDRSAPLLTDLYELTMIASYLAHGMTAPATFDLYVRALPPQRNFLIACGLEQALRYLQHLRFDEEAVAEVERLGIFDRRFLEHLGAFRFSGEVWAVEEGEAVFAGEPLLRVTAPLPEGQLVESYLLNCITFQTLIASKAARVALACRGRPFADFSLRRDHGPTAALLAARAAYIGGASYTSNVLAAARFRIPPSGTMGHSYVMAFSREIDAFRQFARDFPDQAILLIDTYDTEEGAHKAARVARELATEGRFVSGVRLDSGDLVEGSRVVRAVLDDAGCTDVRILASGDLDEYVIADLVAAGAPVDAFGVGTRLGVSADAPYLDTVYKLVEVAGRPVAKLSQGKAGEPGAKQVFRGAHPGDDVVGLRDEPAPAGTRALLEPVMSGGRRTGPPRDLAAARAAFEADLEALPEAARRLVDPEAPRPRRSERLTELTSEVIGTGMGRSGPNGHQG
jgi:nicotinate phosphoribosyltransferase